MNMETGRIENNISKLYMKNGRRAGVGGNFFDTKGGGLAQH